MSEKEIKKIHPLDGTYVKIEGMGGTVYCPAAIIHAALELAGFQVEVLNDCNDGYWFEDKEEYKKLLRGEFDKDFTSRKIQIDVKHVPWGG